MIKPHFRRNRQHVKFKQRPIQRVIYLDIAAKQKLTEPQEMRPFEVGSYHTPAQRFDTHMVID